MSRIQRALLSVTDKTGLVDFARRLASLSIELVSTGGTARALREAGLAVRDISDLTGFPEMLDGRVKTLHPRVHGGILHIRSNAAHLAAIREHNIEPIDMLVVNLYAFEKTAQKPGAHFEEIIENIDIGGPSMVRSAAKNFQDVAIVTQVSDYEAIAAELEASNASLSLATKWRLAQQAFSTTAAYDAAIASALAEISYSKAAGFDISKMGKPETFPEIFRLNLNKVSDLRYGENPHQQAAVYSDGTSRGVANGRVLQGKELSFNNLVDLQAAWDLAMEFPAEPFCAIIKHTNPCGAANGATLAEAYTRALACDPVSAYGGIVGFNQPVDGAAAAEVSKLFVEAIAAPAFTFEAREIFAQKKNLRLVEVEDYQPSWVLKNLSGGLLLQSNDLRRINEADLKVASQREPTPEERRALLFAWRITKHVKSNAIVFCRNGQTVGIGAGQMSRVDAARVGAEKAILPLAGTVVGSDAYFPFPDGIEQIAKAGATAIIQPGGSIRDNEVIEAVDRLGLAMLFTGIRHFRH